VEVESYKEKELKTEFSTAEVTKKGKELKA